MYEYFPLLFVGGVVGVITLNSARIQTWNRLIRSQVLYSVELRSRIASANIGAFFEPCKYFEENF